MSEARKRVDDYLQENGEALERFRQEVAGLFRRMRHRLANPNGPFRRRPNISLRLIADGEPPAKLIILPGRRRPSDFLGAAMPRCELIVEETVQTRQGPGKRRRVLFSTRLHSVANDHHYHVGWRWLSNLIHPRTAEADARRLVSTICSFLADRRGVLARAHDNCCICGRVLTDELSRARGIGPECIKLCPNVVTLGESSILEPEVMT